QQQSSCDFGAAGEELIAARRTDRGPQHCHGRKVSEALQQAAEPWEPHLRGNDLAGSVVKHRRAEPNENHNSKPRVKLRITNPLAVYDGPKERTSNRYDKDAEDLYPERAIIFAH